MESFKKLEASKVNSKNRSNALKVVNCENEIQVIKDQERQLKLKYFGNKSIHFESYITKYFIEVVKLELKRMKDENSIIWKLIAKLNRSRKAMS